MVRRTPLKTKIFLELLTKCFRMFFQVIKLLNVTNATKAIPARMDSRVICSYTWKRNQNGSRFIYWIYLKAIRHCLQKTGGNNVSNTIPIPKHFRQFCQFQKILRFRKFLWNSIKNSNPKRTPEPFFLTVRKVDF